MIDIWYRVERHEKVGDVIVFESRTPKGYDWLKQWGGTEIEISYALSVVHRMHEDGLTVEGNGKTI